MKSASPKKHASARAQPRTNCTAQHRHESKESGRRKVTSVLKQCCAVLVVVAGAPTGSVPAMLEPLSFLLALSDPLAITLVHTYGRVDATAVSYHCLTTSTKLLCTEYTYARASSVRAYVFVGYGSGEVRPVCFESRATTSGTSSETQCPGGWFFVVDLFLVVRVR